MSDNFILKQLKSGTNLICYLNRNMIWNIGLTKNELIYNLNNKQNNNNSFYKVTTTLRALRWTRPRELCLLLHQAQNAYVVHSACVFENNTDSMMKAYMCELFKLPAAVSCVPLSSGHTAETLRSSQRLLPLLRPALCGLVWVAVVRPHRARLIRTTRLTTLRALPLPRPSVANLVFGPVVSSHPALR